jgi:hypothetical protein
VIHLQAVLAQLQVNHLGAVAPMLLRKRRNRPLTTVWRSMLME